MSTPAQLQSLANSIVTKATQLGANLDIAKSNLDSIKATVLSLQQQIATLGEFTQAQLDPIQATLTQAVALIDSALTKSVGLTA